MRILFQDTSIFPEEDQDIHIIIAAIDKSTTFAELHKMIREELTDTYLVVSSLYYMWIRKEIILESSLIRDIVEYRDNVRQYYTYWFTDIHDRSTRFKNGIYT